MKSKKKKQRKKKIHKGTLCSQIEQERINRTVDIISFR